MLPHPHDVPSRFLEPLVGVGIAVAVALDLRSPVGVGLCAARVSFGQNSVHSPPSRATSASSSWTLAPNSAFVGLPALVAADADPPATRAAAGSSTSPTASPSTTVAGSRPHSGQAVLPVNAP